MDSAPQCLPHGSGSMLSGKMTGGLTRRADWGQRKTDLAGLRKVRTPQKWHVTSDTRRRRLGAGGRRVSLFPHGLDRRPRQRLPTPQRIGGTGRNEKSRWRVLRGSGKRQTDGWGGRAARPWYLRAGAGRRRSRPIHGIGKREARRNCRGTAQIPRGTRYVTSNQSGRAVSVACSSPNPARLSCRASEARAPCR